MVPGMNIDTAFATAKAQIQAGRLDEAEATYRQILAEYPEHALAHYNFANLFRRRGRAAEAIAEYEHALAARPQFPEAMNNLGLLLQEQGDIDRAIDLFRQAIALRPGWAEAYSHLGVALGWLGCHADAIAACKKAVALHAESPELHNNLAAVLRDAGQIDAALLAAQWAVALHAGFGEAWSNLGAILGDLGRVEEAVQCYDKALSIRPDASVESGRIFTLIRDERQDAHAILAACREWNARYAAALGRHGRPHENDRSPDRRLRIGYVSPDFCRHVVGWNFAPLIGNHDHEQFEIFCYSATRQRDDLTDRVHSLADGWREIGGMNDERAAEMIRADRIDILVDLALHTRGNRLLVFARKPAPVQVTYLGYCGTTGMDAMDYRLSDPYIDPPGSDAACYSERTEVLPRTYWCYEPAGPLPEVGALPARTVGGITFGSMNASAKVSHGARDLWAKLLLTVPGSRLLVHSHADFDQESMLRHFVEAGVPADRIEPVGRQSWPQYIQTFNRIDIALDTFPCNGGITSLDTLVMGVPMVTMRGRTSVGRGGCSILNNVGLPDLIATSGTEYVRIAASLGGDLSRLAELRAGLRQRMERSPLRDAKGFARDVEAAYRRMWWQWCRI
jgi:protein O-GlcNAc transferase